MNCLPFRTPALFVLSLLDIEMSVLRFIMVSDYPFGIFKFSYLRVCHRSDTQWVSPVEQEMVTLPEHHSSPPVFSGNRVAQYYVLCVAFCRSFLSFFLWSLSCMSFDIRLLITPLVSLNFSYDKLCQFDKRKITLYNDNYLANGYLVLSDNLFIYFVNFPDK